MTPSTEEELRERRRLVNRDSQRRFRQRRQQRTPSNVHGSDRNQPFSVSTVRPGANTKEVLESMSPGASASSLQFTDWHNSAMDFLDLQSTAPIPMQNETLQHGGTNTALEEAIVLSPSRSAAYSGPSMVPLQMQQHSDSLALTTERLALPQQQVRPQAIQAQQRNTHIPSRSIEQNLFEQKINFLLDELTQVYEVGVSMSFLIPDDNLKSSVDLIRRKIEELSIDGV
ncbi:hypothetical protein MBLNU459_g5545t1 [Dothideomycetes sp. NU459]